MTIYDFSSSIGPIITRYITLKQALGRQYSWQSSCLKHLDSFLTRLKSDLTVESFNQWCLTFQHLTPRVQYRWMQTLRNFCLYRKRTESCFVPDPFQFPKPQEPIQPYIFTDAQILQLLNATTQLKACRGSPLRQENFRLALILLFTTGLRRGELLRLTIGDYNPVEHTLFICSSKFHKSRLIPLSYDGWNELETYLKTRRDRGIASSATCPLFWNCYRGTAPYTGASLGQVFRFLFRTTHMHHLNGQLPRLHDFRHSFAVHALLRWYRQGEDVQAKLPLLATYMGHVSIVSTQYYLRFIEPVLNLANERFQAHYSSLITPFEGR